MMKITVVKQYRQKWVNIKHKYIHWLVLNTFCLYMWRINCSPSRQNVEQDNLITGFFLVTQNTSKYAARTGHRKGAQSHKNDIFVISSSLLQKSCCSHPFLQMLREAVLINMKSSNRQCIEARTLSDIKGSRFYQCSVLVMHCSFLWNQSTGK